MLVLEQCTWQDVTIYKSGQFSTCPVSCRGVKLKEKTWLNCSEKFSLTMHHEFSSSCSRIKILLQKNICIQQASMSGDDRGLKKGENLYLLKMCTRPNSGSYTSNIFWASEKSLIVWNPRKCPLQGPAISQHSVASPRWGSRVGITRFRGNKWETLLNNGDKDHLGHLSVALPWMYVHYRARMFAKFVRRRLLLGPWLSKPVY